VYEENSETADYAEKEKTKTKISEICSKKNKD